jgi:hypothetical protein
MRVMMMVHAIGVCFTNTIGINIAKVEVDFAIRQSRKPRSGR